MKLWYFIIIAALLAGGAFYLGLNWRKPQVEVVVITKTLTEYVAERVDHYVSYPIQAPVEVIKEVEVFRELTDWDSVEELEAFLEQDDTDKRIVLKASSDGVIKFNGQCEDYALQLRDRAMAQGKYLSIIVLEVKDNRYHALCMARIGNEFWYVEPKTDECWLGLYLD